MINLSTPTLLKSVIISENWSEQIAMLEALKERRDLYNLDPILELALDERQHPSVRRAATECAATRNQPYTLDWLRRLANDYRAPAGRRKLAVQGLAALQLPNETLPVFEQLASRPGPYEVRAEALRLIGKFRNLRNASMLTILAHDRDTTIAQAASAALETLVEGNGGRQAVADKMIARARDLYNQGKVNTARDVLQVAARLDPYNGRLLYERARLNVA